MGKKSRNHLLGLRLIFHNFPGSLWFSRICVHPVTLWCQCCHRSWLSHGATRRATEER